MRGKRTATNETKDLVAPLLTALYIPYVLFCSFSVTVVLYFQHLQLEVGTVVVVAAFPSAISSHRVGTTAAGTAAIVSEI